MADQYLVIRLVPKSPIDGTTFSTYLDNLALQVFEAKTDIPLSGLAYAAPLSLVQWPPGSDGYLASAVEATYSEPSINYTNNYQSYNYGTTLEFASTNGISVGSFISSADQTTIPPQGLQVTAVDSGTNGKMPTVTLSGPLPNAVPAGTTVSFVGLLGQNNVTASPSFRLKTSDTASKDSQSLPFGDTTGVTTGLGVSGAHISAGTLVTGTTPTAVMISKGVTADIRKREPVTFTLEPPFAQFTRTPSAGTPKDRPQTLTFSDTVANGFPDGARGIPVGAVLDPIDGLVGPGTTVTSADTGSNELGLYAPLLAELPDKQELTFSFTLSKGIVQHTETIPVSWNFFLGETYAVIPAAAATAIIQLNPPTDPGKLPSYLDIEVRGTRDGTDIRDGTIYHNVKVNDYPADPAPDAYQQTPEVDVGLYFFLPPPPDGDVVSLEIPPDGTAPPFDTLSDAINKALHNEQATAADTDPIKTATLGTLVNATSLCERIAYDIVWSYQNDLPPLPDPLESLYTNPPNAGGGGSSSTSTAVDTNNNNDSSSDSNNYEMDRQKFEGALNSFYATRNASAERLAKFVAAASGAAACEVFSRGATTALLTFPVDPAAATLATAVESEVLLNGLGDVASAPDGLGFGVPAAFFYVLGAGLHKTTAAVDRFQLASDSVERLLQQFTVAEDAQLIQSPQDFAVDITGVPLPASITSFEAARRLVALGVSAASNTPSVTIRDKTALATLIEHWRVATDPGEGQDPPPTYQADDFAIWSTLAKSVPDGYLHLDLEALTQGWVIPPLTASPSEDPTSDSALTFAGTIGIGPGMPVSGQGIASGTTVQAVSVDAKGGTTKATLSTNFAGVTTATAVTFNAVGGTTPPTSLADQIATWLTGPKTVETLKNVPAPQWTTFFTKYGTPQWLPPFTRPVPTDETAAPDNQTDGYVAGRIRAWVRAVQRFFTVSTAVTTANPLSATAIPELEPPLPDPIGQTVKALSAGSTFGSAGFQFGDAALTAADLASIAPDVLDGDAPAQAWLIEAMLTINELWEIAGAVPTPYSGQLLPYPVSFRFSLMEALYARGFTCAADIAALSAADFQQALTGTIAYDYAPALYQNVPTLATSPPSDAASDPNFQPVNPDGSLVDCVPPPCLSPTGPIAYLRDMLAVSVPSTGDDAAPAASSASAATLGAVLSKRRGPVGDLAASTANLETPLPLIDLVNECLEFLAAAAAPAGGTVHDTTVAAEHDPARLLAALPEHSTPATPDPADPDYAAVEPAAFNKLKADFSSCELPYSQALDVSRTYLDALGSSRFEEMRTFRRCITEFVLDPGREPAGFESWRWRLPVRIDIAIEYLGITPEEYSGLFHGTPAPPCVPPADKQQPTPPATPLPHGTVGLPAFLAESGLSYCEFRELWESGFVTFTNGADGKGSGAFPECEPCCPEELWLRFPDEQPGQDAATLLLFVRLGRKLRDSCDGYSFAQLRDICDVLRLRADGATNPDFIRQLAAFQMLRDDLGLDLTDPDAVVPPDATGADRTQLLALWTDPTGAHWPWAVRQLISGVERQAQRRHGCDRRPAEFVRLLTASLEPLSRLAGFDPDTRANSWEALPTHTLRFAEVLAKIYASPFSVGELLFLFTALPHLDGDDPFPLQDDNEALDDPLGLPADDPERSLWRLRGELLADDVQAGEANADDAHPGEGAEWPWPQIESALEAEFGFAAADITALGQHLFPVVLARAGQHGTPSSASFTTGLAAAGTSAAMWNNPPDGPFRYDPAAEQLTARIPLTDRAVITKLSGVRDLHAEERTAVQDLFFQPRALLARFALLFADFAAAQRELIEAPDEARRFRYFRREFLLCRRRTQLIAGHLARNVAAVTGQHVPDEEAAALILRTLAADEDSAVGSWEDDSGAPPKLTWPRPAGGALAALLGLAGTGVVAEYRPAGGPVAWRDRPTAVGGFGHERDRENCPVPTVLPALDATLTPEQLRYASVRNGLLMRDATGALLGGAQGFTVTWAGTLLIEQQGSYEFWAGEPTPGEDRPGDWAEGNQRWRVVLRRGQRTWVILSHHWDGEEERPAAALPLKRGAYELVAEFSQPAPELGNQEEARPRTGFHVKYRGPDSAGRCVEIPHRALFATAKSQPLGEGIKDLSPGAAGYLGGLYGSSLRDIRRTYQRAFKALLFCQRLGLSAHPQPHGTSELGYLLEHPDRFAGAGYYRGDAGFTRHSADLDFDFLPLRDGYRPPAPGTDARADPKPQRVQAMFDWWERLFDYAAARADVRRRSGRALWHLFEEAWEKKPDQPGSLLRHLAADERHWRLDLRFFQGQSASVYEVTFADLADDRWTLRAWHAVHWLRGAQRRFAARDIAAARPDLWASDDPSAALPGETRTGNASLLAFVTDGYLDGGEPRRYDDPRGLTDGLRDRGRRALIAYLCHQDRVPLPGRPGQFATTPGDLSDLLLLDVECGLREKASRIEEACSAAQTLIRRSRLGLEPGWPVTQEFARIWESRFGTYRIWERARHRELYRESWIEWDSLVRARRIEAFRFLESQLRTSTLAVASPGGLDWWADDDAGLDRSPEPLQRRVPSRLRPLPSSPAAPTPPAPPPTAQSSQPSSPPTPTNREGFTTIGRPEYDGQPTWLAAVAAAGDGSQPQALPLWLEAAMKMGTRFVRVAAAGVPEAGARLTPHGEPGGTCRECGRDHPAGIDEYYFWLVTTPVYTSPADSNTSQGSDLTFNGTLQFGFQDPYYDQFQQQSTEWNDESMLPGLLAAWQPGLAVRLAWCRVHHGQFGQPRRSAECVPVDQEADQEPDLAFLGRAWDSLHFEITGITSGPSGFRYDLASDHAVALPEVLPAQQPATLQLGGLPSYPFFAYHGPGTRLFPASWFPASLTVAGALRARSAHGLALRWYQRAFDPLRHDCAWVHCPAGTDATGPASGASVPAGACCDATQVTAQGTRDRAVTLHYCATLIEWGDALMRRGRSPEAFRQAQVLYETAARITGPRPRTVMLPEPASAATVTSFVPAYPPLNPRLMELYDLVGDRLTLIRGSLDAERIRNGRPDRDMPYFGTGPQFKYGPPEGSPREEDSCGRPSPYRFLSQVQKATELAGRVRELGGALLSAYEKGDAEYLASIHAGQEREMQALGIAIRQDQWRDADWQVQALQQTKDLNQAHLLYNAGLYQAGLLNTENQHLDLTMNALTTRTGANLVEAEGEIMNIIPDPFVGAVSSGASVPAGTKLAHLFEAMGRIMQTVGDIMSTTAAMDATVAGWQRRAVEWLHQTQTLPIEIQQIELQILGAHRRRDQALRELNNQQRQVENAAEVQDFLRDKFTATDLYLWLQQETAALHRQMYDLAATAAREAERSFNFELRNRYQRFIPEETWDSLHAGLLAGERLDLALHHMEKSYLDQNRRELELTKQISLRLDFPLAYLRLRTTGYCEISVPEWMFDRDYPGHYLRRLKAVQATLPVVASPLTGVHCRLTLLSSMTRVSPEVRPPAGHCCQEGSEHSAYASCPEDPRVIREYAARESIATSSGQTDSGLFELSFRDERYLPFEYLGAVSRWRIELPPENNYFDLDTLTDLVLHVSYTAREGGAALREAAARAGRERLPGDGLRFFDVRHDFPDAWPGLRGSGGTDDGDRAVRPRQLRLGFTPTMFPFVPGRPTRVIDGLVLMFAAPGAPGDHAPGSHHPVRFWREQAGRERAVEMEIECVADEAWPGFSRAAIDLREHPLGPLRDDRPVVAAFEIPADAGEIGSAFVLASYDVTGHQPATARHHQES